MPKQCICLTFDVEEFDLPLEYGQKIEMQQQIQIGYEGLQAIMPILQNPIIETTLFTTANFAQHFPNEIYALAQQHEIASHTFYHSSFELKDLKNSKEALQKIAQKEIYGLRMPRMKQVPIESIIEAGYTYDSSINPTYLPGRYNNTHLPKTIYEDQGLTRIPTSVTPTLRIPLFWLAFKNFPFSYVKYQIDSCLKAYGFAHLYFHPWEFSSQIAGCNIPFYTKKGCNGQLLQKLTQIISTYKNKVTFNSLQNYLSNKNLSLLDTSF